MRFLRRLFGLDFPDPQVGQVWRSRYSGRCILVENLEVSDRGTVFVSVYHEGAPGDWIGIANHYAIGLSHWRGRLKDEARELMGGGTIEPSTPGPRK